MFTPIPRTKINYALLWLFSMFPLAASAIEQPNNASRYQSVIPATPIIRDPFTPSRLMFDMVGKQSGITSGGAYGFTRSLNNINSVPKMRLRGFVSQGEEDLIALLEIAGARTYLVREGDEINIDPSQPSSAIRITKITRLSVTVETGTLGSIRVQR